MGCLGTKLSKWSGSPNTMPITPLGMARSGCRCCACGLDDRRRLHADPYSARIFETYLATSRLERWLYHGLHSLDFPLLYKYRPL